MNTTKSPTELAAVPSSAFDRWVTAAAAVTVNVPKWMWEHEDENPPTLLNMGSLVLSVRHAIDKGKIYEAQLCSDNENGWQYMMPDDNNTGESDCPDQAVIKCLRSTLRQLTKDKDAPWRNKESKMLCRRVRSALRKVLRLMQNAPAETREHKTV
jgi:hypothetical protein